MTTTRLILCLTRCSLVWFFNPRTNEHLLRSRTGHLYRYRRGNGVVTLTEITTQKPLDDSPHEILNQSPMEA